MCWSESLLQQLQHESIASGARQQQVRGACVGCHTVPLVPRVKTSQICCPSSLRTCSTGINMSHTCPFLFSYLSADREQLCTRTGRRAVHPRPTKAVPHSQMGSNRAVCMVLVALVMQVVWSCTTSQACVSRALHASPRLMFLDRRGAVCFSCKSRGRSTPHVCALLNVRVVVGREPWARHMLRSTLIVRSPRPFSPSRPPTQRPHACACVQVRLKGLFPELSELLDAGEWGGMMGWP